MKASFTSLVQRLDRLADARLRRKSRVDRLHHAPDRAFLVERIGLPLPRDLQRRRAKGPLARLGRQAREHILREPRRQLEQRRRDLGAAVVRELLGRALRPAQLHLFGDVERRPLDRGSIDGFQGILPPAAN
jgi:hypothetical protein